MHTRKGEDSTKSLPSAILLQKTSWSLKVLTCCVLYEAYGFVVSIYLKEYGTYNNGSKL